MLKTITTVFALCGAMALGQDAAAYEPHPDWENPQNLSRGREESRAFFVPFANRDEALKGHRRDSSLLIPLNGEWQFHWAPSPDQRPLDFADPDKDFSQDAAWGRIDVPCNWQMRGYGTPIYSNQAYTFVRDWPRVMTPPRNENEELYTTPKTEPNAVGSYRRDIELPADWDGREVFIQFDGVDSFFYLYVNGEKVGFSKDSRTAAIFDITKYVKPGNNVIGVEVYRYSDGSYLECQDMWRLSGIFRDCFLYSTPKTFVRDFFVHTDFARREQQPEENAADTDLTDRSICDLRVEVDVDNRSKVRWIASIEGELLDARNQPVTSLGSSKLNIAAGANAAAELSVTIKNPLLWSAEKPNLYRLMLYLRDEQGNVVETISKRIGFRDVKLVDGRFLVNGMPVKLKGVNRHESQHANGHTVTEEECLQEILLMKRGNINHIRNSHYPQPSYFYDLCDEYGIYVCDEANIESHGYYYGEKSLSHPKEWEAQHVWRNKNMVEQSKNHPCVVIWSYGNEAGPGANFAAVEKWIKWRDPSRLTQYERNNDLADLCSNQYPSVNWAREMAGRKLRKPWYISEYAHILCNSMGNLKDYWDAINTSDSIIGGGIWEWIHQSYDQEVTLPDGKKVTRQSYGGDHNEYPNDGIFCIKGVIYSDRTVTPLYAEIRKVQQNADFSYLGYTEDGKGVRIGIKNRHLFTDLKEFIGSWSLEEEGKDAIAGAEFRVEASPLGETELVLPLETLRQAGMKPDRSYFLTVNLHLAEQTNWAPRGYIIATEQILLPEEVTGYDPRNRIMAMPKDARVDVRNENSQMIVIGPNFTISFDKATGGIRNYIVNGQQIIGEKPTLHLNAFRAPLANDKWAMNQWLSNGLRNLVHTATPLQVERLEDGVVRISCDVKSQGARKESLDSRTYDTGHREVEDHGPLAEKDFHFTTQLVYTIMPNGYISVQAGIVPSENKVVLPKLGYILSLPERYNNVTWHGRGPGENYPDRKSGSPVGIYSSKVADMVERYPLPMEMGNRMDTRWVSVTDDRGVGLLVSSSAMSFLNFSALPCTPQALMKAPHPEELEMAHATVLSIDALTLGLGGAACGPLPMNRDIPLSAPTTFVFSLCPILPGENPADIGRKALPLTGAVTISRDELGYVKATCGTRGATIRLTLADGSRTTYSEPFLMREEGIVRAKAVSEGRMDSSTTYQHFPTWKPDNLLRIADCSSYSGRAESPWCLIDGRRDTFWHSEWREPQTSQYPHHVTIDLGADSILRGFTICPRQASGSSRVRTLALYLSMDGRNWNAEPDCTVVMPDDDNEQTVMLPEPKLAKFVKMVCLEPITANQRYAAIAELTPLVSSIEGEYPPNAFFSVSYASSELPEDGPARNVLDGNRDTFWHTMKGVTVASFPHDIRINLGAERRMKGLVFRGAPMKTARVKDYEVYVSQDGENWGNPVARGTLSDSAERQEALFFSPTTGKFLKFVALSAHDGGDSAAVAELDIITAN